MIRTKYGMRIFNKIAESLKTISAIPTYHTPKPEFPDREKIVIATMGGKKKKQYVKILKDKYQTSAVFK